CRGPDTGSTAPRCSRLRDRARGLAILGRRAFARRRGRRGDSGGARPPSPEETRVRVGVASATRGSPRRTFGGKWRTRGEKEDYGRARNLDSGTGTGQERPTELNDARLRNLPPKTDKTSSTRIISPNRDRIHPSVRL